jgi:chromosomal replication initiation ATPase DnaA
LVAPCNQAAISWLDRWPAWPGPGLAVYGPPGCGKTHLAHVFQARSGARLVRPADIQRETPPLLLEGARACILDGGPPLPQRELLHLYNALAEKGGQLLILSRLAPARWDIELPDLASRLAALPAVRIEPPDDALIEGLLIKLFADRQLTVAPGVVSYLRTRLERSFDSLRDMVDRLDRESLARRRAVSLTLAREILEAGSN